jgi:hypothetical protein
LVRALAWTPPTRQIPLQVGDALSVTGERFIAGGDGVCAWCEPSAFSTATGVGCGHTGNTAAVFAMYPSRGAVFSALAQLLRGDTHLAELASLVPRGLGDGAGSVLQTSVALPPMTTAVPPDTCPICRLPLAEVAQMPQGVMGRYSCGARYRLDRHADIAAPDVPCPRPSVRTVFRLARLWATPDEHDTFSVIADGLAERLR